MRVVVRVACAADGSSTPHDGRYVVAWNPHCEFGILALDSTADLAKARRFKDIVEVFYERGTISNVEPRRPDGAPNRPLRAITIMTEPEKS